MTPAALKDRYERQARALRRRPVLGRASGQARVHLAGGDLRCEVEHGQGDLRTFAGQSVAGGGAGADPDPGQLMRASLGAGLAIGYRIWGARLDVAIDAVEVDVVCQSDERGQLGIADDVAIGWQRVTFDVRITSAAPEADVRRLVALADRLNPMLANLSPGIERVHRLTIAISATSEGTPVPAFVTPLPRTDRRSQTTHARDERK